MGTVERVYQTDNEFIAEMVVDGCRLVFPAAITALRAGASLTALKNSWVRECLRANGDFVSSNTLKATAKEAVVLLRDQIEPFFVAEGHCDENDY